MGMKHYTFFIMKQESPSTEKPWCISCMTIDEERETVIHRIVRTNIETQERAQEILEVMESKP